jgi:predicted PurR-regulated permease PerM
LQPFLSPIAWAIVLSIVFYPVFAFVLKFVKWRPLASFVTLLIILVIIFGPVSYLSYMLSQEIKAFVAYMTGGDFDPVNTVLHHPAISNLVSKLLGLLNIKEAELQNMVVENLTRLGKETMGRITGGLGNAASAAVDFVLMLLSIFFFLEEGPQFIEKINNYMPFSRKQRERLIQQTRDIVVSTIYGGVTVAIFQAIIGGFAFSFLGIPSPGLWGTCMFIASFIPLVGTFVVWGPAALYLFFKGSLVKAGILVLIGILGISSVDNIVRPLIIRGRMKLPILAIFFSILGGIKVFGIIGFIMGPLVLALFLSVVQIVQYVEEKIDVSD